MLSQFDENNLQLHNMSTDLLVFSLASIKGIIKDLKNLKAI